MKYKNINKYLTIKFRHSYSLIPWCRIVSEKLTVTQLVKQ